MNKGYDMFKCQSLYKLKTKKKDATQKNFFECLHIKFCATCFFHSISGFLSNTQMPVAVQLFISSSSPKLFLIFSLDILLFFGVFFTLVFQIGIILITTCFALSCFLSEGKLFSRKKSMALKKNRNKVINIPFEN